MALVKRLFYLKIFCFLLCFVIGIYLILSTLLLMEKTQKRNTAGFLKNTQDAFNFLRRTDEFISTNFLPSYEIINLSAPRTLQRKSTKYRTLHRIQARDNENNVLQNNVEKDVIDRIDRSGKLCGDQSKWTEAHSYRLVNIVSNMSSWTFHKTFDCPYLNISEIEYLQQRPKMSLYCNKSVDLILSTTWTHDDNNIYVASFDDKCVDIFITECCKGNYRVPTIVHYVWYMRGELSFVGFTSLLSVIRFVKPCIIMFHGDSMPYGPYWTFIVSMFPYIIQMKRERPEFISGQKVRHKEHSSDVMRIEALLKYGGIYLDTDTVIVKSIESLMNYSCVMSNQSSGLIGSAFVMAEKNASFLQLWMDGYRYHYNPTHYVYNAMIYPLKVAHEHSDLIHIEYATISRPVGMIGGNIYNSTYATYNWSHIYGIHLYSRIYKKPFNEHTIRTMNTIAGSICRHIIFGNKELCNRHGHALSGNK